MSHQTFEFCLNNLEKEIRAATDLLGFYKIQHKYIAQKYYALQLATYADTKLYFLIVLQYRLRVALKSGSLETKFVGGASNIFILKLVMK
jgi:hypothetical protein